MGGIEAPVNDCKTLSGASPTLTDVSIEVASAWRGGEAAGVPQCLAHLSGGIPFQGTDDLLVGLTFLEAAIHVGPGPSANSRVE